MRRTVVGVGGARVFTVGVAVLLAVMLWIAATSLSPSGTAIAQDIVLGPVGHVQVEKKYDQVYPPGKKELKDVRFHGIGAGLTIHKPSVGNPYTPPENDSLAQIALFTWDGIGRPYAIEFGWIVSSVSFGKSDNEPHLFLAARRPGNEAFVCEIHKSGQCGFTYVDNPYVERDQDLWFDLTTITPPIVNYGTSNKYGPQTFHIGYYKGNNAWWIQFQDRWIGYIDAKWFGEGPDRFDFKKAEYAYWYGEVLSSSNSVPCALEMGNGKFGTEAGSARFVDMFVEKQGAPGLVYTQSAKPRPAEGDYPRVWRFWNGKQLSATSFSYGGPGPRPC